MMALDLDEDERYVMRCGLVEWGGPARCTEEMARAMGFESISNLFSERHRLIPMIERGDPLSVNDWLKVLVATEVVFASNVVGSGLDWPITTGVSDAETIGHLRSIQQKLGRALFERRRTTSADE
jgi:hypothetical protein